MDRPAGLPADALLAVRGGADTLESMRLVGAEFRQRGWSSAVLVTDPWHAMRAERTGVPLNPPLGTMIELPRAAMTAGQIAEAADFFSFGTNDLTQTTWGFSRDDVEAAFFSAYLDKGIFGVSPFESLDREGVGQLVRTAVERGRSGRPDLHLGVCGEHGGDPDSVHFFHEVGLDYVSCSPFRVPVARLEAGRASVESGGSDSR